jgi:ribose transport system permease protein
VSRTSALPSALKRQSYLLIPAVVFAVLLLATGIRNPNLLRASGLTAAILVVSPLILATLALTPIVMAGRGAVDLAVGPLLGFLNVTLIQWVVGSGVTNPIAVFLWPIAIGVLYQLAQALVVVYVRVAPIIVALSSYLFLSGINLMVMPHAGGVAPDWMMSWSVGTSIASPVLFVLAIGLVIWFIFTRTAFHNHIEMTGADERMAYTAGVRTDLVRIGAYLLGGVYVGLAAICYTALISSGDPTQGSAYSLQTVTALVLGGASLTGGRGGAIGSILGALDMYLISSLLATFDFGLVSGYVTQLSFGAILIASLLANILLTGPRPAVQ